MSSSMLLGLFDWIGDFFKSLFDLIPKVIYLLYASFACVLDVLQLFFRKLAGLDVYYVDGKAISGDLVTNFITGILGINSDNLAYSALSTVFWSMFVFGIIICFASTLIAVIKSHYSYDDKAAKGPMQYVYTAGKAVLNMVAVPIIIVLGLYVSQALLTALDSITSTNSGDIVSMYGDKARDLLVPVDTTSNVTYDNETGEIIFDEDESTYIYYDIFGFSAQIRYGTHNDTSWEGDAFWVSEQSELALIGSKNQTFSGSLFRIAAYNANRVRNGTPMSALSGFGSDELFANANNDEELGADMVDTAFANNLHLNYKMDLRYISYSSDSNGVRTSFKYFTNFLTQSTSSFSKFNVGLVWYYYDLWQFNFIVAFGAIIVCLTIFINIIFGLMTRVLLCIALFLIAPPLFGLAPLDGGKAGKSWRENFMKQILMAYGAVVGMNLALMILPYFNEIDFFNIPIADYFAQVLFIIVGLITIKALISTISGLIGGADANETGGKISEDIGQTAGKAVKAGVGMAAFAGKTAIVGARAAAGMGHAAVGLGHRFAAIKNDSQARSAEKRDAAAASMFNKLTQNDLNGLRSDMSNRQIEKQLMTDGGLSKAEAREVRKAYRADIAAGNTGTNLNSVKGQLASASDASFRRSQELRKREAKHDEAADVRIAKSGEKFKKAGSSGIKTLKDVGNLVYKNFASGDKAISTFLDKSDIYEKPDHQKAAAKASGEAAKAAKAQAAMQEWQMLHPGQTPSKEEMESLRKGEQPK